ncbi:MAG: ribonuclease HII [Bacteroidales bacterium]
MLKPYHTKGMTEAGCDEAGRGCIAGPVFAAAVILPERFFHPDLNDSKKLSKKTRELLRGIIEREAVAYGVAMVSEVEIDQINILNASFLAMHRALDQLTTVPDHLLIDGNRFRPYRQIPHSCIVKGDSQFSAIAAASVLAKTYRDEFMEELHRKHPQYGWDTNKGYPTAAHRKALMAHGPSRCHRRSFRLFNDQMRLDFS